MFRFRRRAPAVIVSFAALVIVAMAVFVHELTDVMVARAEASDFFLMRKVLADVLRDGSEGALVRAELISSMPSIRKAFATRDRALLAEECKEMFAEQRDKYGMDEGQFLLAPGTSFLRLHAPESFGDDQSKTRPILADVFSKKQHKAGVVLTPSGVFLTALVPMEDLDGKLTGAFEMGLDFEPTIDEMKNAYGIDAALFLDAKLLRDVGAQQKGEGKPHVGGYVRTYATHDALMDALTRDAALDVTGARSYSRVALGATWGVQLVPLYDHANHPIGVIAMARDFSGVIAMEGRAKVWQIFAAFVTIVLLTGVVLVVIRGALLRPLADLTKKLRALADGDASQPADDASSYCEELQELAESYERLRGEKQP